MIFENRPEVDFSIIIPTRNEEKYIGKCLDSLLSQDFQGKYEIIVVDGMSEDTTVDIVSDYCKYDKQVSLITNPERITPCGFNRGIQAAKGKILMTVGGHWHLPIDYLTHIKQVFDKYPEVDCLGGRIVRQVDTEIGQVIEMARGSLLGGGLAMRNESIVEEKFVEQINVAYIWRRHVFDKVGLFDQRFVKNQDNEFNLRTLLAGFKTMYSPKVVFYYYAPSNFSKLYHQMFGYASYMPMMMVKHRRLLKISYMLPAVALLMWLTILVTSLVNINSIWIAINLVFVYIIILIVGGSIIALQNKKLNYWPVICYSYLLIHTAVSFGYLYGLYRLFDLSLAFNLWHDYKKIIIRSFAI